MDKEEEDPQKFGEEFSEYATSLFGDAMDRKVDEALMNLTEAFHSIVAKDPPSRLPQTFLILF